MPVVHDTPCQGQFDAPYLQCRGRWKLPEAVYPARLAPDVSILKCTNQRSSQLHDVATGVLSRRIGGSKTGLLNSSMVRIYVRTETHPLLISEKII